MSDPRRADLELRRAVPAELTEVGEVTVAGYACFTSDTEDFYLEKLRDAAARDHEAELWVAADPGTGAILGTVTCCPPGSPWRELAAPHEGEFRMLAVRPEVRGRGVGTALVTLAEERARHHGATGMVLSSLPEMCAAHRIYTRAGYTRAPERDWDPVPGVHLVAFTKELS